MDFGIEFGAADNYRTADDDQVFLFTDGSVWWVTYIYADQSPQFIKFAQHKDARRLFDRTRDRDAV